MVVGEVCTVVVCEGVTLVVIALVLVVCVVVVAVVVVGVVLVVVETVEGCAVVAGRAPPSKACVWASGFPFNEFLPFNGNAESPGKS